MPIAPTLLPFTKVTPKQKDKFWKKVAIGSPDECWPWIGALKGKGYGTVRINKIQFGSSRVGWLIVHGADPFPFHILHKCDNRLCCNPAHWFLGTNHENILDRNRKGRGGRKLTAALVRSIKKNLHDGRVSQQAIADDLGINQTLVSAIKRGVVWSHVSI